MAKKTIEYNAWLKDKLVDPVRAARYLNAAQADSPGMFLKAMRKVAAAQGRPMTEIADAVGVSRESLYRMMSESGNPTFANLSGILEAIGFRIKIEPIGGQPASRQPE